MKITLPGSPLSRHSWIVTVIKYAVLVVLGSPLGMIALNARRN
jgi:hypothetical protein